MFLKSICVFVYFFLAFSSGIKSKTIHSISLTVPPIYGKLSLLVKQAA